MHNVIEQMLSRYEIGSVQKEIDDPASLQHWSTDYFLSLAEKMAIAAQ